MIGAIIAAEHALTGRFPDLLMQMDDPSLERVRHDLSATDSSSRFACGELFDLLVAGPGAMDPEREVAADEFDAVAGHLKEVLALAYERSFTFRRLFNRAADTHLRETRWFLAPNEAFGTTVTPQQRAAAGHRAVIGLNCDTVATVGDDYYACVGGMHPFSSERSYVHEIIHALTGLTDVERDHSRGIERIHPRGAVVEYENLVMKEIGDASPARISYRLDEAERPGTAAVDFSSIDFGSAFGEPSSPASVLSTASSLASSLSASPPP
jgi:hypothetical protein